MTGITHHTAADGTFSAAGSTAWGEAHDVADNSLAVAKLAAVATSRLFGRLTAGAGAGEELTAAQVKTLLAIASSDVSGLAASATTDATNASNISSGTLPTARLTTTGSGNTFALATSPILTTPIIGSYTFATLPAAASNSGAVARVTDVGATTAGSLWISNGTIWKPVNGSVAIVSNCARTSVAGAGGETLTNLKFQFPAAFFNAGDRIRIYGSMSKAGTTTQGLAGVRMGTNGTTADAVVFATWAVMANASRTGGFFIDFSIVDATHTQAEGAQPTAATGGSYLGGSTTVIPANVVISNVSNSLWVEVTITPGATDAVALENGRMEYLSA